MKNCGTLRNYFSSETKSIFTIKSVFHGRKAVLVGGGKISSWRKYFLSSNFQLEENQQSAGLVMNSIVSLHNSAAMKNIGNSLLRMCEVRMRRNIFRCQEKYWRPSWKILSGMMSHTARPSGTIWPPQCLFYQAPPELWQCLSISARKLNLKYHEFIENLVINCAFTNT